LILIFTFIQKRTAENFKPTGKATLDGSYLIRHPFGTVNDFRFLRVAGRCGVFEICTSGQLNDGDDHPGDGQPFKNFSEG
jgi:hypothetical protein